jgi:hypothetical protein
MHRWKLIGLITVVPLIALAGISVYWSPKSRIYSYSKAPSAEASSTYTVAVNGQAVPVELYHTTAGGVSFARFAFAGAANVVVTVNQPISQYVLSPKSDNISATVAGNTLVFTLSSPQRLVLRKVNNLSEELFLLADAPEANAPQPGAPGVTNALSQPGVNNTGTSDAANGLNAAMQRITQAGGGTLYVPAGVYLLDHGLQLKSNVNLYLAPGAVLQLDPNYPCCLHDQGLISIEDAVNAKLSGRGLINGNSINVPSSVRDFHMIVTENVQNLEIDDVTLLDQGTAALRLVDAHNSNVRNLKSITNHNYDGSDGLDFDSSDHILVDNAFVYSSDDSTSQGGGTGVRGTVKNIFNLTVQNSVFYNTRTGDAFKIGTTDPQNSISNEIFTNIDIVSAVQVGAFYPTQGADINSITLSNIRADEITDRIWEFQIEVPYWEKSWNGRLGFVHDINIENVSVASYGKRNSSFYGYSPSQDISNIAFTNYSVAGQLVNTMSGARIDTGSFVNGVTFSSSANAAPVPSPSPSVPSSAPLANGTYIVTNEYSGLVLDDPNFASAPGTQIIQWAENGGANQKWRFTVNSSGFYTIQNVYNGLMLADTGGKLALQPAASVDSQLWTVSSLGSGLYTFANKATGRVADDAGVSNQQGNLMITWPANNGTNQNWSVK